MSSQVLQPRVKICGITSTIDAEYALAAGVDAIGLVFYAASPRYVLPEQARAIAAAVGPLVTVVGLFVDAQVQYVSDIIAQVPLNLLQFHGNESADYCRQFSLPYLKAIRMKPGLDLVNRINAYRSASGILLDSYRKGMPGGTGACFDWRLVPAHHGNRPLVLAGGLTAENVQQAITRVRPYGVDISGGVESAPGIKDEAKIQMFMQNVRREAIQ